MLFSNVLRLNRVLRPCLTRNRHCAHNVKSTAKGASQQDRHTNQGAVGKLLSTQLHSLLCGVVCSYSLVSVTNVIITALSDIHLTSPFNTAKYCHRTIHF